MCELKPTRTPCCGRWLCAAAWFLLGALTCAPAAAQSQQQQQTTTSCNSASRCLSLGLFYYNNDDISDQAAKQFRKVLTTYKRSAAEAEKAQFYLASYYQRKYYIKLERTRKEDRAALQTAQAEYRNYTTRYIDQKKGT